jgi:hypothetical protein
MITNEQTTASHDTKSALKMLFDKVGSEKERTAYVSKYVEER